MVKIIHIHSSRLVANRCDTSDPCLRPLAYTPPPATNLTALFGSFLLEALVFMFSSRVYHRWNKYKLALRGVRPLRRQDGPPLRVAQQLRGLRKPPALRGVRVVPAGVRGALPLGLDGLHGQGNFFRGERAMSTKADTFFFFYHHFELLPGWKGRRSNPWSHRSWPYLGFRGKRNSIPLV